MLDLDSPRWSELEHAYGKAKNIPSFLAKLSDATETKIKKDAWFYLWSALAHQGEVYSASFASVPHIIQALKKNINNLDISYLSFPVWVEICRNNKSINIPEDIAKDYFLSISELPKIIISAESRDWDEEFTVLAISSIALAKGFHAIAEAVQEMNSATAKEFLGWVSSR
jgi:hypothetical protein